MTTLLSFTPHPHFLAFSAVQRRHQPPTTTTLKKPKTNENVRFLCSPYQRVSRFVVPCGVSAIAEDLVYNAGATVGVLGGAYALVFAFDDLTKREILHQDSNSNEARYFAAFVPLVNCLRLLVNGLSLVSDKGLVKSVTREGDPRELLRGPLYYVMILMLSALVFWRESPVGVVSLAMMCGGDGVADIIGRRYGSIKIPYNDKKSWAGSISMLVIGFLVSLGMLYYYSILGHVQLEWVSTVPRVAFVAFVATVVESLPITQIVDDNISVPLVTMALASFIFQH
ncbi:hypothetical protein TanjilG_01669 [Lupinus angustifolius]|uniref:probable phytol kinase 1, chloroplastic isoform X2 n=1 Tax=Lupinus angustifolius TaxID=3871 RepID=UPI00090CE41B|nr:PREDICTED: probable phytol kinase 1, chloroplastic isoform X2 [Lupinus angustifolius]OIV90588.1 hypothetical protein TanjilG_01669 [Lupinus angustifolius]